MVLFGKTRSWLIWKSQKHFTGFYLVSRNFIWEDSFLVDFEVSKAFYWVLPSFFFTKSFFCLTFTGFYLVFTCYSFLLLTIAVPDQFVDLLPSFTEFYRVFLGNSTPLFFGATVYRVSIRMLPVFFLFNFYKKLSSKSGGRFETGPRDWRTRRPIRKAARSTCPATADVVQSPTTRFRFVFVFFHRLSFVLFGLIGRLISFSFAFSFLIFLF